MSDKLEQRAEEIRQHGLQIIERIKDEIVAATEALKRANKELEECPKEDASENAQLMTARENQARANHALFMLQKRLDAFEQSLTGYTNIGSITLGTTVQLVLETIDGVKADSVETTFILRVVHKDASDIANGFIATTSRVGEAILGHVEGETINISAPRGELCYRIERII